MKKRLPSPFDIALLLLVIAVVVFSSMLVDNKMAETPQDVSELTEELRTTTQRYTNWDAFNTPEEYIQTYVVRFSGDAAQHPEYWPEPGTRILSSYGNCPDLGVLEEMKVISDDPENPVLEATLSCYCSYYKTAVLTPASVTIRLGTENAYCVESGYYLGIGTIVKMN